MIKVRKCLTYNVKKTLQSSMMMSQSEDLSLILTNKSLNVNLKEAFRFGVSLCFKQSCF